MTDIKRHDGADVVSYTPASSPNCQVISVQDLGDEELAQLIETIRKSRKLAALKDGQPEPITVEQYEGAFFNLEEFESRRYLTIIYKWIVGHGKLMHFPECPTMLLEPGKALIDKECAKELEAHGTIE